MNFSGFLTFFDYLIKVDFKEEKIKTILLPVFHPYFIIITFFFLSFCYYVAYFKDNIIYHTKLITELLNLFEVFLEN